MLLGYSVTAWSRNGVYADQTRVVGVLAQVLPQTGFVTRGKPFSQHSLL